MTRQGFTLVELLIVMLIIGVILGALLSFQTSTMRLSTSLNDQSDRLGTLTDLSGYLGSRVREAAATPDNLTLNGSVCSRTATPACLSVIVPTVNTGSGDGRITGWQLLTYRYSPRSMVPSTDREPSTWLDSNAQALYEERYASTCAGTTVPPNSCFSGAPVRVLLSDRLSLRNTTGSFVPFTVEANGDVTLRLRAVSAHGSTGTWTPDRSADPFTLTISPRNN